MVKSRDARKTSRTERHHIDDVITVNMTSAQAASGLAGAVSHVAGHVTFFAIKKSHAQPGLGRAGPFQRDELAKRHGRG